MTKPTNALLTKEDVKKFILDAMRKEKVLTRKQLMAYFNWNQYMFAEYIDRGMPWFGRVTRKQFILNDVKKWLIDNNIDGQVQRI